MRPRYAMQSMMQCSRSLLHAIRLTKRQCRRCFAARAISRRTAMDRRWNARSTGCRASGMAFIAETGSGHVLTMDGAPDGGGRNLAPRPMETVLAGTGGCTAYDVVLILQARPARRARLPGQARRPSARRAIRRCSPRSTCTSSSAARGLPAAAVERAIALSHEKYCSATHHAGQDGRDHHQLRDRRGLSRAPQALRCSARSWSSPWPPARIAQRTGAGSGARAGLLGLRPRGAASSSFICATIARDAWSPAGSRSRWLCEVLLRPGARSRPRSPG